MILAIFLYTPQNVLSFYVFSSLLSFYGSHIKVFKENDSVRLGESVSVETIEFERTEGPKNTVIVYVDSVQVQKRMRLIKYVKGTYFNYRIYWGCTKHSSHQSTGSYLLSKYYENIGTGRAY